jgi:Enoyl-CoA hydratase/isomerase
LRAAAADTGGRAVVLLCGGRTFVAGADISEFGKPLQPPPYTRAWNTIEVGDKLVVAAIHGTALCGGLDLALVCPWDRMQCSTWRRASSSYGATDRETGETEMLGDCLAELGRFGQIGAEPCAAA